MFKLKFYTKIFIYYVFNKSKFLLNLASFFGFLYIKVFKKNKLKKFEIFFENYANKIKNKENNGKKCIHINFFSWFDYENYLFSCLLLGLVGSKCKELIFFKSSHFKYFKNRKYFAYSYPISVFSKINIFSALKYTNILMKKSYYEIFNYKYLGINCGKYSISSSIRVLKTPKIDLNNSNHFYTIKYFIFKSIINADASINYIKENTDIEYALFNDKSYVGAGELYDECIKSKIKCIQYVASYKNNILLLKKYNENNKDDHPSSISDEVWNKFKGNNLSQKQSDFLEGEILTQYKNNSWYPSAGTMIGKKIYSFEKLKKELKLDDKKKIAIIFPHIFWDGTFFFGKDLFKDYIEWYKETLIAAEENKNINWVIKSHPSNVIKNNREKISNKIIEPELKIIYDLFGKLPSHFRYMSSQSEISTVNLFELLDFCFTIRGTVGIEAALKNKIVITAGTGRYNDRGFTFNYENKEKYFEQVKNLHYLEYNNENIKENAKKFAYIAFTCKTIDLDILDFYYKQNKFADLDFSINIDKLNSPQHIRSINFFNSWLENDSLDYFQDPCKEWYI
tara:strand:- start:18917 stop:20614 length:1698 start_codon:yes stop_codon:yes gene_type:complete